MADKRIATLANTFVHYACRVEPGENVLVEAYDGCEELLYAILEEIYATGANPHVWLRKQEVNRMMALNASDEQLMLMAEVDAALMKHMQAYIGLKYIANNAEMGSVPPENMGRFAKLYAREVHGKIRINTKWCSTAVASSGLAQLADMSTREFESYYYDIVTVDYAYMKQMMEPLKRLMERTDKVQILGEGTDITFSIKGMPAVTCAGEHNIPDGEVFSAPLKGSINGRISFNTPSVRDGFTYDCIVLTYKDGVLTDATANDTERIRAILSCDEGAKGVGEFSLGLNPYIVKPMKFIPFDEKICGSFHFTPGNCYKECDNGNKSSIHWDLVNIQTPEYGGGEIYFDDVLIRKDGRFVLPELEGLNPENLMKIPSDQEGS